MNHDAKQQAFFQRNPSAWIEQDIADAARAAEVKGFVLERVFQPAGGDAVGVAQEWDQRKQVARLAVDFQALSGMDQADFLRSINQADVESNIFSGCWEQDVSQGLVPATAQGSQDQDLAGAALTGVAESQFQVCVVFVGRVLDQLGACLAQPSELIIVERVEIADHKLWRQAERQAVAGSAIGGNQEIAGLKLGWVGEAPIRKYDRTQNSLLSHRWRERFLNRLRFLRRHYPDQVRGSKAGGLPLSPAILGSPCR